MKVRFAKPALAELDAIFAYIHKRNPVAAGQVVARVREITSQLGRFPDMGHPKYKPGVRMITVRRYHRDRPAIPISVAQTRLRWR